MSNAEMHLAIDLYSPEVALDAIRNGFGRGLLEAGHRHKDVVAICADLTGSTKMDAFAKSYPERYVEVGIAEQNLVTVGSGMAAGGKIPFVSSYAAFSPGRNWEQIRTTIALNERNVKIVGSHAGLMTGPDGATHQALEDIALMRVLPKMTVVVPSDSVEAEKATLALALYDGPAYLRVARDKSPVLSTEKTPFALNKANILRDGKDVSIVACGVMVYNALIAAEALAKEGIEAEVINAAVVKPLDSTTIIASARRTGRVITAEEAQIAGGLGSAVTEVLAEHYPVPVRRIGVADQFGQSGTPQELFKHYGLTSHDIVRTAKELIEKDPAL